MNTVYPKHHLPFFIILGGAILIFLPTFQWSFHIDDIDYLYLLSQLHNPNDIFRFLFQVGEGQWNPFIMLLYFVNYTFFGINPLFFHVIILSCWILGGWSFMSLIYRLTKSSLAIWVSGLLFVWSTAYARALDIPFAHLSLSLALQIFALLNFYRYATERKRLFLVLSALSASLIPFISAMGLLTGVWLFLFAILYLPNPCDALKKLLPILLPWFLASFLFIYFVQPLRFIAKPVSYLHTAALLTVKSIFIYTIPLTTFWQPLSWLLWGFLIFIIFRKKGSLPWRLLTFFILWIIGNYFFIFCGRGRWGDILIFSQRYGLYASMGTSAIVGVIVAKIWGNHPSPSPKHFKWIMAIGLIFLAIVGFLQHQNMASRKGPSYTSMLQLKKEWQDSMKDYIIQSGHQIVELPDALIKSNSFFPKKRPLKNYASFLLSPDSKKQIVWTEKKTTPFILFLENNASKYPLFFNFIKRIAS